MYIGIGNSEKNSNESKLNCDDKTEMLPSSQKEDIMNDVS